MSQLADLFARLLIAVFGEVPQPEFVEQFDIARRPGFRHREQHHLGTITARGNTGVGDAFLDLREIRGELFLPAHGSIQMTDASRPVGACRRWLKRSLSSNVQRGSTPILPTPALASWFHNPARRSRAGVPLRDFEALPGRCFSTS